MYFPEPSFDFVKPEYREFVKKSWAEISELEEKLSKLKWWNFIKKHQLNYRIWEIREPLISIGLETALDDLERMGLVKRV